MSSFYTYDEGRERVTKTGGANPVTYVNDYYEKEGTIITKYINAGSLKIATIKNGTLAYNHLDHLSGSTVSTATNRTVLELNDYNPYGNSLVTERVSGYTNDYLFTGKERDEETNLYYYGARYYDPLIGRFTSIDPWGGDITDPQSLNKYAYARNNPLKYNDPSGGIFQFALAAFIPSAAQALEAAMIATMAYIEVKHLQNPVTLPTPATTEKGLGKVSTPVVPEQKVQPLYTPANQDTGLGILTTPPISQNQQTILQTPVYRDNGGACGVNMSCSSVGGYDLSNHALDQMKNRQISYSDVEKAINSGESFSYEGNKTGYYDKNTNIFVGAGTKITTVIKPRNSSNYINNLKNRQSSVKRGSTKK